MTLVGLFVHTAVVANEETSSDIQSASSVPIQNTLNEIDPRTLPLIEMLWGDKLPTSTELMTKAEKDAALNHLFSNLSMIMPIMQACSQDIERHCDVELNPLACLADNIDSLNRCCLSNIHSAAGNTALPHSIIHHDVLLPTGSNLEFDSSCGISRADLSETSPFYGVRLQSGSIIFDESGKIELAQLVGNQSWRGLPLASQQPPTRISEDGVPEYIRLAEPGKYQEFELQPLQLDIKNSIESTEWKQAKLNGIYFYLYNSGISRDTGTTKIHPNGQLARGNLAKPLKFNGIPLAPGITTFTEQGQVLTGTLSQRYSHEGLMLDAGPVTFSETGKILTATLAETYQYDELILAANPVVYYESGHLSSATLAPGSLLNSKALPTQASARFDENGKMVVLYLPYGEDLLVSKDSKSFKLGDLTLKANNPYKVHENGQPKNVVFFDHQFFREKLYPSGTELKFNQNGEVIWDSYYHKTLPDDQKTEQHRMPEILPFSQVRQGIYLPKGSIVHTNYSGTDVSAIIPREIVFNNALIAAGDLSFGTQKSRLASANLHKDQDIDGIRYSGKPKTIMFDEHGQVAYGFLSGDQPINNIWFADGTSINLYADRKILQGILARLEIIDGFPLQADSKAQFYINGKLERGTLGKDHTIDGLTLKEGTGVWVNNQGNFLTGTLAHDHHILGITVPANTNIGLSNGKLSTLQLNKNTDIQGYTLDGRAIRFYENGKLQTGVLARKAEIDGEVVEAGTQILFDSAGQLVGTDSVGILESKDFAKTNKRPPVVDYPPTKELCEEMINGELSKGTFNTRFNAPRVRQCRSFYVEYSE